jgi:hypothetical protein
MSSNDQSIFYIFNSGFFLSLAALIFGFCGVCIKVCYQSKCKECNLCFGLIKIDRDIEAEEDIDLRKRRSTKDLLSAI